MREIEAGTVVAYLKDRGRIAPGREARAEGLGWGVSNVVVRVEVEGEAPIVVKQARARLRTEAEWVSRLDRIWTEREALDLLATVLPEGAVPRVVFDEPDDYLIAMTSAPVEAEVWKARLLNGVAEPEVARRAGAILGRMHAGLRDNPGLAGRLGDRSAFVELWVDPFYRAVARVHPDLAPAIAGLIEEMDDPPDRTFVHADFSPKNLLVDRGGGLTVVDFETAHAGDPAFDVGFFLSHLTLKAFRPGAVPGPLGLVEPFWSGYHASAGPGHFGLSARATRHAAACLLARVDGVSPVDYLDEAGRTRVREVARSLLLRPSLDLDEPLV